MAAGHVAMLPSRVHICSVGYMEILSILKAFCDPIELNYKAQTSVIFSSR